MVEVDALHTLALVGEVAESCFEQLECSVFVLAGHSELGIHVGQHQCLGLLGRLGASWGRTSGPKLLPTCHPQLGHGCAPALLALFGVLEAGVKEHLVLLLVLVAVIAVVFASAVGSSCSIALIDYALLALGCDSSSDVVDVHILVSLWVTAGCTDVFGHGFSFQVVIVSLATH